MFTCSVDRDCDRTGSNTIQIYQEHYNTANFKSFEFEEGLMFNNIIINIVIVSIKSLHHSPELIGRCDREMVSNIHQADNLAEQKAGS